MSYAGTEGKVAAASREAKFVVSAVASAAEAVWETATVAARLPEPWASR